MEAVEREIDNNALKRKGLSQEKIIALHEVLLDAYLTIRTQADKKKDNDPGLDKLANQIEQVLVGIGSIGDVSGSYFHKEKDGIENQATPNFTTEAWNNVGNLIREMMIQITKQMF